VLQPAASAGAVSFVARKLRLAPWWLSPTRTLKLFFSFTQHPFAIPHDPALKCVDGTIRANLSFVAVALHQFERAVATSHLEAKMVRAHPNYSFSFHAGQSFFPMIRSPTTPKQDAGIIGACGKTSAAVEKPPF
jgi:hypothetical protein